MRVWGYKTAVLWVHSAEIAIFIGFLVWLVTELWVHQLVQSLASLCVFGDNIAVHSAEIGAVIGLIMCIWWQNCSTETRNWYSHWSLYACQVTKLLIWCKILIVICLFICVHWQQCSRQTRNWYNVHWLLFVCLVTKLQYTDQKLVHSLASLCVSGDKIAVHKPEIGTFTGLFMCVWWQNCSTQTRNWYIHWPLYVCLVTKLQYTDQKLVHSDSDSLFTKFYNKESVSKAVSIQT